MSHPPSFFFFFLLLFISTSADTIFPGYTLSASIPNQTWNSPNSAFTLGFIPSSSSTYFAAVFYNLIPLWKAGGDSGIVDSTASLQFLPDGNLRLINGSSGNLVWESNTAGRGVSSASLDESGKFALLNGTVSVWSTFENPTHTILPSQNFTLNKELKSGFPEMEKFNCVWESRVEFIC